MPNLPRFRLEYDEGKEKWILENEQGRTVKNFETKEDATAKGVLKKAVGTEGGTVRIHKQHGGIQEERTFPRSRDPRKSKG
jgi:Uncharacterized protein conserved in bacteria (DUF2188)